MAGRPKKDKFADLPKEFKEAVSSEKDDALNARISTLAKNEELNQKAKKEDEDLNNLKDRVAVASAGYKEATKAYKLKMKFIMSVLDSRGTLHTVVDKIKNPGPGTTFTASLTKN